MSPAPLLERAPDGIVLPLVGLEVDNLVAFLALLGLLRALERHVPSWQPRASWAGPPWMARLHLAQSASEAAVAMAVRAGMDEILCHYDVDGKSDVNFDSETFLHYLARLREQREQARRQHHDDETSLELATAIAVRAPSKTSGIAPGPLVMMFGQGHQHFLDRLLSVPRGDLPNKLKKRKNPPKLNHPKYIEQALFRPWTREDETDGFRWDAEEDQRYALRATNPSDEGAAPTVHGANQLAAIGLLSFTSFPCQRRLRTRGVVRTHDPRESREDVQFVWPIWTEALARHAIEDLLTHDDVLYGPLERVRPLGIVEVFRARRINNGKYLNVARARP